MNEKRELNKSTIDSHVNDLKQNRESSFFGIAFDLKHYYNQMTSLGTNELTNLLINEFLNRDIQITHVKQSKLFFSACRKLVSNTFGVSGIVMNAGILYQALGETIILKKTYPSNKFLNQYHPISSIDELQSYLKTMETLIAEANKDPDYLELREKIELQIKTCQTDKDNYLNKNEKDVFLLFIDMQS